jgi:hypothetical protein
MIRPGLLCRRTLGTVPTAAVRAGRAVVPQSLQPLLVTGVHGGELLVHHQDVLAMVGRQRRDRRKVSRVTVFTQELDRRVQRQDGLFETQPHRDSRLHPVLVFQQYLRRDREAGLLIGVVHVGQPGGVPRLLAGRHGSRQGEPGH